MRRHQTFILDILKTVNISFVLNLIRIAIFKKLLSRNFDVVIFKKFEEQMYREGPVLLSLIRNQTVNILPQLREELKENVRIHGFR